LAHISRVYNKEHSKLGSPTVDRRLTQTARPLVIIMYKYLILTVFLS